MASLVQISMMLLNSSAVAGMRGHPEHRNWQNDLLALSQLPEAAPLADAVKTLASTALVDLAPVQKFWAKEEARKVPLQGYWAASKAAEQAADKTPHAAFLLAWLCLNGWFAAMDDQLYEQYGGMPSESWVQIPYACATIALRIGAVEGAMALADHAYEVIASGKYSFFQEYPRSRMEAYRQISAKAWRKIEMAVANLADELRAACRPELPNFRAEAGAMLWSLGMIPESLLFKSGAAPAWLPSRRFFTSLVRQSIECMTFDPLLQYVWLELKDRPPFNIRDHKLLFQKINAVWAQSMFDALLPDAPSRAYAQALIAWFRGDLNKDLAQRYMEGYSLYAAMFPEVNLADFIRLESFADMVAHRFGWVKEDFRDPQKQTRLWLQRAGMARQIRNLGILHPEWPETRGRSNAVVFHIVESAFSGGTDGAIENTGDVDRAVHTMETLRAEGLLYWLMVVPPVPSRDEHDAAALVGRQEQELLSYLRGEYFRLLSPVLPRHYGRRSAEFEQMDEDRKQGWGVFDADDGRKQFREVYAKLESLYTDLEKSAPRYAKERLHPEADLPGLIAALASHAQPS